MMNETETIQLLETWWETRNGNVYEHFVPSAPVYIWNKKLLL